jgi:hypothetical protein
MANPTGESNDEALRLDFDRPGKSGRHALVGMLRQAVFGGSQDTRT